MPKTIIGKHTIKQYANNGEKFYRKNEALIRLTVKENVERMIACGNDNRQVDTKRPKTANQ